MKRVVNIFLLCCLLCCLFPFSVLAADRTYKLEELGMSIDLPDDHVVFTRDISSDDPNLSVYGLTKDSLSSLMYEENIYLNAWDESAGYEIIVAMTESSYENFNLLSDTTLNRLTSFFEEEYKREGVAFIKSEIYRNSQTKFIKLYISQPDDGETAYGLRYYTVYNGKDIIITIQSYSGEIDSRKESLLKGIVDSAHFDDKPTQNNPPAQTAAYTYTDANSGLTFTVPENWAEAPKNEEYEYINAKFKSLRKKGSCIIFASEDLWDKLSAAEKLRYPRNDANNSLLSKADVAEMYGCGEQRVSMVSLAGKEYFKAEFETTETIYGLTFSLPATYLMHCENGYVYLFQFFGENDSEYYDDFESLMNSTVYPSAGNSKSVQELWSSFSFDNIAVSLIITVSVYSLPIVIFRYAVLKKPVDSKKAKRITVIYGIIAFIVMSIIILKINRRGTAGIGAVQTEGGLKTVETTISSENEEDRQPTFRFCHKCGKKLFPDSVFCHGCGTKIPVDRGR